MLYNETVRIPVEQTISFGLEELAAGLYFISLHFAGKWYTGKIMKM